MITADTIEALESQYTLTAHMDRVTNVAFSPNGAYLALSSKDGKIHLWDTQSCQEMYAFDIHRPEMRNIS